MSEFTVATTVDRAFWLTSKPLSFQKKTKSISW
jgi:hypothetical protein